MAITTATARRPCGSSRTTGAINITQTIPRAAVRTTILVCSRTSCHRVSRNTDGTITPRRTMALTPWVLHRLRGTRRRAAITINTPCTLAGRRRRMRHLRTIITDPPPRSSRPFSARRRASTSQRPPWPYPSPRGSWAVASPYQRVTSPDSISSPEYTRAWRPRSPEDT